MQVHHGNDVKGLAAHTINNGIRKSMEVELAIFSANGAPALRFSNDAPQSELELVNEIFAQTRLLLFIPLGRAFQFQLGFRMADDLH